MKGYYRDIKKASVDSTTNKLMRDVIGNKSDAAAAGVASTTESLMAYIKQLVGAYPRTVVKSDGSVLNGVDPLFIIAGGLVRCKIMGLVTTVLGATASTLRLQHITTVPAATVQLNAGAVTVTSDAAGTIYTNQGATSVFTPSGGLGFDILDPVTIEEVDFILAPGVVQCLGSAANTGVIAWYMTFDPLSSGASVVAAA